MPAGIRSSQLALACALVVVAALGASTAYRAGVWRDPTHPTRTDVFCYVGAADALAAGHSPFGVKDEHGYPYVYPPAVALFFVPLRELGRSGVPIAWFVLSVAVLALGVRALRRALGPIERPWLALGVPLALVALPTASALLRGQTGPLLTGLVALGCAGVVSRREGRGGLALGAAVAMKATPILALGTLALDRRPRALAGAAVAIVVLLGLGPALFLGPRGALDANMDFVRGMGIRYAVDPASQAMTTAGHDYAVLENANNQSLTAVLHRSRLGATEAYKPVALALSIAVVVLALLPAIRLRGRVNTPLETVAALGLAAGASLLVAPVAWHHHHVLLLPALMAVTTDAARRKRGEVFAALAIFYTLEVLHFAVAALRPFGLLGLATIIPLALAFRLAGNRSPLETVELTEPPAPLECG